MDEPYVPRVNDYVVWDKGEYGKDEGWVYFVGDVPEVKKGFRTNPRYITIETDVKPKPSCVYTSGKPMKHKMIHTLLLCYESSWHQLKFVKHRNTREIQHWSQYDDIIGNEEDKLVKMYKSQEGRPLDTQ